MVKSLLVASHSLSWIKKSFGAHEQPQRVHGATPSSLAYIMSQCAGALPQTSVLLCSTQEEAHDVFFNLCTFLEHSKNEQLNVIYLPGWETSPYSSITPAIKTRLGRIAALSQIIHSKKKQLIVCDLTSASQATLSPDLFKKNSISLSVNQDLGSKEAMIQKLNSMGYLHTDPVEDEGTYSSRGELIDIFPPGYVLPIRIELFDTIIENIRFYDPTTQRTQANENKASENVFSIPPAREVLINSETFHLGREKIKIFCDELGVQRAIRDPLLESLSLHSYPEHSDTWAPFVYETPATLFSYLEDHSLIYWFDELGSLQNIDQTMREAKKSFNETIESETIVPPPESLYIWSEAIHKNLCSKTKIFFDRVGLTNADDILSSEEGVQEDRSPVSLGIKENTDLLKENEGVFDHFDLWLTHGYKIEVFSSTQTQLDRIQFLIKEKNIPIHSGLICFSQGHLSAGFRWPTEKLVVLTDNDFFKTSSSKKLISTYGKKKTWSGLENLSDLAVGDAVVHIDHGVGRYLGLTRLRLDESESEFIILEYANNDKLYLPVYRLNIIQKYFGASDRASLDRLGSSNFEKAKLKVKDAVKKLAIDLVALYAQRQLQSGYKVDNQDALYKEFEAKFPYSETPDQHKAVKEIFEDLSSGKVMDRLICGDVGYGKTEVAIRAAFQIATSGKQVAVLVPTTILAFQHEQSFKERMKDYPLVIESLSRFKTKQELSDIISKIEQTKADIIIGTHRILSRDVKIPNLALVIVDEEHRFGVEHKEKLKALKLNTHVLSMSATPIPRTLHMSLSGLRDISLITTPPVDRMPVRTFVSKFDDHLIQRAIEAELKRGGQVFFIHNRVQSIYKIAEKIQELVPFAKLTVAHGQMSEKELEEKMIEFYSKKSNVLVSTTIIESGLDIPSANTIIIDRADTLGLAQLYQLRGRVGRSDVRAYAYLLISSTGHMTEDAKKRLEVIQRFVELGSGFSIASHDLEIRGGGNLLGAEQSGHIAAVGFELYTDLLNEAVAEAKGLGDAHQHKMKSPEIKTPFSSYLDEDYIPDVHQRLTLYRKLSGATSQEQLLTLEEELIDRYGKLPESAQNLLWIIKIKLLLEFAGIETLVSGKQKYTLIPLRQGNQLSSNKLIQFISDKKNLASITPDSKIVIREPHNNLKELYFSVDRVIRQLIDG